jgi:biopolymer transport protein ExbD
MSRFRRQQRREVPLLNTSALPDLIFTSLFFFMIVTHIKPVSVMTQLELPKASELQKLEEKSQVVYIILGHKQGNLSPFEIQLNSEFVNFEKLPEALKTLKEKSSISEWSKITAVIRADKDTPMGLIIDVKKILREANLLTVHYSASKR